jgi:hypothetical protein
MAIAYVQNTYAEILGPQASPLITANFSSPNTAGNSIVVVACNKGVTNVYSAVPTDTLGNVYVQILAPVVDSTFGGNAAVWWCPRIQGGSPNAVKITWTGGSVQYPVIYAIEYSGLLAFDAGLIGNETSTGVGSSVTMSTGNFTTTETGVIVAVAIPSNTATAPGTNYTERIITPSFGSIIEDYIRAPPGINNAMATQSSAGAWMMAAVNFSALATLPTDAVFFGIT